VPLYFVRFALTEFFFYSRARAPCVPNVTIASASVPEAIPIPSFEVVEDDLFSVPLPDFIFSEVSSDFKRSSSKFFSWLFSF
jgi:hypothetical protein